MANIVSLIFGFIIVIEHSIEKRQCAICFDSVKYETKQIEATL